MKKVHRLLGSAKFIHGAHLALMALIIGIVPLTSAQAVHVIRAHNRAHKQLTSPTVPPHPQLLKKPVTPAPAPKPTTTPVAVATPAPAPKAAPVATPTTAPAAVAAVAASPGTGVGSLAPAPSQTPPPTTTTTSTAPPPSSQYTSTNWSGYMATASSSYTAVSGNWTVPSPTGNTTTTTVDAAWIGIGGVSSPDLIQVGTEDTVSANGTVASAVFYELLPASPIYPSSVIITPGDQMQASISEVTPGQWSVSITDLTTGKSFTTSLAYTSSHTSAEWIEEDPSYQDGQLVPFDSFGSVSFTQGFTTAGGTNQSIASSLASSITLVDQSGKPLAVPSALSAKGTAFTVTRQ